MKTKSSIISLVAAIITIIISILVLIGWITHNGFLKSFVPGTVTMKFNVALGFIFSSVALLLNYIPEKNRTRYLVSNLLSALVLFIGLLTIMEYIFGMNPGIDEFFVKDEFRTTAIYYAGRMSPLSAINFVLIGTGLLLLNKKKALTYQFFYLFGIAFTSLLMLIGYNLTTDIPTFIRISIHVAIGFITLSVAIWFAQPMLQNRIGFERKIFTGFASIIILIAVISLFSSYYNDKRINSSQSVKHANYVLSEAEQTLSLVMDIESSGRGYIITSDTNYLEYFFIAEKAVSNHVKNLKTLTKDNPVQQARIDSLSLMIDRRISFSRQCIQLVKEKNTEAANKLMATSQGKLYTNEIRYITAAIQGEENKILAQQEKENAKSIASFNYAFIVFLAGVFILLLIILFSILDNISIRKKSEKQRKESEEQIQAIFNAAPDSVIVIDEEGKIIQWNPKSATIFGWSAEEVMNKPLSEIIIPHRYREAHQTGLKRFLQTGQGPVVGTTIEIQALNKNNTEFDVALSISPTVTNGKHLFIGFLHDITEKKRAEKKIRESELVFSTLFYKSPIMKAIAEASTGKYIEVNDAFADFMGHTKEEIIGKTSLELQMLVHPGERGRILENLEKDGFVRDVETEINSTTGKTRWVSTNIDKMNLYGKDCYLTAAIDITQRKLIEEKIISRTEQLKKSKEEIEAFSYSVSHDLRAPLRGIIGFAAILEEDYGSKLDDEARRFIGIIKSNTLKMGNLVDDLLAFSRLGRQDIIKANIDTQKIIQGIMADLNTNTDVRNITWEIQPLPYTYGDLSTIRQVWINLISNAIKYSTNTTAPHIEIGSFMHQDQTTFFIKDNGVGFDIKYRDKLFKVFQRLHGADEFEGTGVGLAIAEKIISKHGGKIWAEAEPGRGATFYFSLPGA